MTEGYDYSKTWVTEAEAQELHEIVGLALITVTDALSGSVPVSDNTYRQMQRGLRRALEIAGNLVSDLCSNEHDEA